MGWFNELRERMKKWGRKRDVDDVCREQSPQVQQDGTTVAASPVRRRVFNRRSQRGRGYGVAGPGGKWWSPWDYRLESVCQQWGLNRSKVA